VLINYAPPPSAASAPPPQPPAAAGRGGGSFALLQAAEEAAAEMRAAEEAAAAVAKAHTQALAETDAEGGRALKTRRLSRDASTSAEKVLGDAARRDAEAVGAVRSAKEHAETEAARANASLLELRAQYDAMQRRYEESEAALER